MATLQLRTRGGLFAPRTSIICLDIHIPPGGESRLISRVAMRADVSALPDHIGDLAMLAVGQDFGLAISLPSVTAGAVPDPR